ncbi:nitrogen fixation NifU-like protein [Diaminobutyricimonas aerilata]|uniref:Nitrogen fixation NifU-like protein n=1 Tax=Diaminobutyricimonas aerilata TaxID=1162967 RepID=A0A2M9CHN9_9MICO|nr:SUF system NifU family Fe-S cluster assembly protein [Diaminobutyricimonas aerilata]PJJ71433.1 nitrogen fixation NifU-like protein [Diaminobutyricimonas aerilata]
MTSSGMESLYQQVILDHAGAPNGVGLRGGAAGTSRQVNPTCGDEVTVELHLDGDRITEMRWEGHGCAISQASASLLSELTTGLTADELDVRIDSFRTAMRSRGAIAPDEALLGDAVVLGGVSRYIARVKCAMLPWVAVEKALAQARTR